jgi:CRP/FNR family transcriptional regulator, cyclic AMP receptor protein
MTASAPETPEEIQRRLAGHAFFKGLPEGLLKAAADGAKPHTYRAGEFLLREGRVADEFFVVVDGKVALEVFAADRRRITVQTVGPGEVLGWSWLASPHRWSLDAIAVKTTRAIAVQASTLWARFAAQPAEGYEFLLRLVPVLAGRIQAMEMQLLEADVL